MTARVLPLTVGVLVAGVLIGSGLAALGNFPPNDACVAFGPEEGSSSSGTLEFWPLGTRCETSVGSRVTRSEFFGPSQAELYVWIVEPAATAQRANGHHPAIQHDDEFTPDELIFGVPDGSGPPGWKLWQHAR